MSVFLFPWAWERVGIVLGDSFPPGKEKKKLAFSFNFLLERWNELMRRTRFVGSR